jgi:predicted DsbA family dithiol-disulfide isomerase
MQIQIYADVVCPWCYIGVVRLMRAIRSYSSPADVEVSYLPYQLDPDAPATPEPLESSLRRKYGRHTPAMIAQATAAAHEEGLVFRLQNALAVNTLASHQLLRHVLEVYGAPSQVKLMDLLYRAYFEDGRDVGDTETLVELASELGMGRDAVEDVLSSDEGRQAMREEIEGARHRGITAVPTFVFEGQYALQGAQPPAVFLQALNQVGSEALSAQSASE